MKFVIVFVAFFAVASAASVGSADKEAKVVSYGSDVGPNKFNYAFETSNGISENAEGILNAEGSDHESIAVHGSYSFPDKDGHVYTVNYVADENGFQPQGAHLPHA